MTSTEIGTLLARLNSKERKCSDETGADILAMTFRDKTYSEHLRDLQNDRVIRDAKKAKIRLENPEYKEWQVVDELNCKMPPEWWEGDPFWEPKLAWRGETDVA